MATFLELCVKLAEESGTGAPPTTVVGQVGRQKKLVSWVRDAWVKIQNLHAQWFFLRGEFQANLVSGTASYTGMSFVITRFGGWLGSHASNQPFSLYSPTIGVADQSTIHQISWDAYKRRWDFGVQTAGRPTEYAFAPDGTIRFGAKPDAAYVVKGQYLKTAQVLALDADVPDMPVQYHDAILRRAMMLLRAADGAIAGLNLSTSEFIESRVTMERDLLPQFNVRSQRPLA